MKVIKGNIYKDERGIIRFVNDFDMTFIKRMYCIEPELGVIRAWQGHKKEVKWFYVVKGSFLVKTVTMDLQVREKYYLSYNESMLLEIPGGYYNGFEAMEEGSVLMVFSNFGLEESKEDDFRESLDNIEW
jgi:dTDP-4-dehydrorhamnose 3,5-epimerase